MKITAEKHTIGGLGTRRASEGVLAGACVQQKPGTSELGSASIKGNSCRPTRGVMGWRGQRKHVALSYLTQDFHQASRFYCQDLAPYSREDGVQQFGKEARRSAFESS